MISQGKDPEEEYWECFLCAEEFSFSAAAFGWLADYHPLCKRCTTKVVTERGNIHQKRLTTLFSSQCYLPDFVL